MAVIQTFPIQSRGPRPIDNPLVFPAAGILINPSADKKIKVVANMSQATRDDTNTLLTLGVRIQDPTQPSGWKNDTSVPFIGGPNQGKGATPTPEPGMRVDLVEYQNKTIQIFAWMPTGNAVVFGATISSEV